MRLSLSITNFSWPGGPDGLAAELGRIARQADAGTHHRLTRPINSPAAITRPHPPILIGGMGEKKTLRFVARYAQACNLPDIPDGGETIRRKLAVLAEHCAAEGRPYEEIDQDRQHPARPRRDARRVR